MKTPRAVRTHVLGFTLSLAAAGLWAEPYQGCGAPPPPQVCGTWRCILGDLRLTLVQLLQALSVLFRRSIRRCCRGLLRLFGHFARCWALPGIAERICFTGAAAPTADF